MKERKTSTGDREKVFRVIEAYLKRIVPKK